MRLALSGMSNVNRISTKAKKKAKKNKHEPNGKRFPGITRCIRKMMLDCFKRDFQQRNKQKKTEKKIETVQQTVKLMEKLNI